MRPVNVALLAAFLCRVAPAAERLLIFPIPQKMEALQDDFQLDETATILVPKARPASDMMLARLLAAELSDRYGLALRIESVPAEAESYLLHAGRNAVLVAGRGELGVFDFLHASARGASNDMSYRYIHNFPDTADLLGWYDLVYDDGFVDTVPVRFGKAVKEIRLHGTSGFLDTKGKPTPDNAIILAGVSVVKKRPVPPAEIVSR